VKKEKYKHLVKKETNQTLGEKRDKPNTWRKKGQRQTRGQKREKDKHLVKKERKTSTW
jgi:hypothetical protein